MPYREFSLTYTLSTLIAISLLLVAHPATAASQNELKGVKSEISRQKQDLTAQQKKLEQLQSSLKKQELSIVSLNKGIAETKEQLSASKTNTTNIEHQIKTLTTQKKIQTESLEQLLQTYYVTQRAKAPSHILNSGIEEDRISQYYQHLAKARSEKITQLVHTQQSLATSHKQLKLELENIASLLKQQTTKRNQLANTQSKRKKTVGSIKKNITGDKSYLAELQRNETRLQSEIAKAAKRNSIPMDGLAKRKGRLPWPIKGKVLHNYGTRQTGQVDWKGMVINANYGQAVKAVYSGTVVFAEYLRGYGLVVLLDHGKGDMTLYGFNQALAKKEGDKVAAGETIALAGDTGGQTRPSLYFEIRRNSQAQNPTRWLVN